MSIKTDAERRDSRAWAGVGRDRLPRAEYLLNYYYLHKSCTLRLKSALSTLRYNDTCRNYIGIITTRQTDTSGLIVI